MCISLRPSTYFMGSKVNLGSCLVMGAKSLFWYHLYSTLSWARSVAGWETTLSGARSAAGWETKLRAASHWILVASSLSILNFQNAVTPLGYMVGLNISVQGTCLSNDTMALVLSNFIQLDSSVLYVETSLWFICSSSEHDCILFGFLCNNACAVTHLNWLMHTISHFTHTFTSLQVVLLLNTILATYRLVAPLANSSGWLSLLPRSSYSLLLYYCNSSYSYLDRIPCH